MSLINQMLRDLERRQAGAVADGNVLLDVGAAHEGDIPTAAGNRLLYRWAILGVLGLAFGVAASQMGGSVERLFGGAESVTPVNETAPVPGADRALSREVSAVNVSERAMPRQDVAPASTANSRQMPNVGMSPAEFRLRLTESVRYDASTRMPDVVERSTAPALVEKPVATVRAVAPTLQRAEKTRTKPNNLASVRPAPRPTSKTPRRENVKTRSASSSPANLAETRYGEAMVLLQAGKVEAGEALLLDVVNSFPKHLKAREMLTARRMRDGKLAGAGQLLRRGLELYPAHGQFTKLYGRVLVEQGRMDEALAVLNQVALALEQDSEFHALRAAVLHRKGDHRAAAATYQKLLITNPDHGVWWMGLAIALESAGEADGAKRAFRRASRSGLRPELRGFVERKLRALGG